jgi:phosphoribosylaminoimidazolecarboxamide formyltransferase/IMP cyclohydrolase
VIAAEGVRENLRVLELPADWAASKPPGLDAKRVQGGWLVQDWDLDAPFGWQVVTARAPSEAETRALRFAWRVCRHVKSNAIVLARDLGDGLVLVGAGGGQTSRVDAVKIAVGRGGCEGSALASDAFFPFDDGVKLALEAGVRAFIQPGGSIRDADAIAAADAAGATMVFTGTRHFRH